MFAFEICNGINGIIKSWKYKFRGFRKVILLFPKHQEGTPNVHCFLEANHIIRGRLKISNCNV